VGTVVASTLAWPEFADATGDRVMRVDGKPIFDPKRHQWAPCDKRGIVGSHLEKRSGRAEAPDLRGVFLRGLNQFVPDESKPVSAEQKDTGPARTEADIFQKENVGGHGHKVRITKAPSQGHTEHARTVYSDADFPQRPPLWHVGVPHGDGERGTDDNPTGETRPKNVAMYYYIKIN